MPRLSAASVPSGARLCLLVVVLLGLFGGDAWALEPTTVRVEGVVDATEISEAKARELAFQAALEEAVFEVARLFLPPNAVQLEEERIREALAPRAPAFVLTYRVHGPAQRRPSEANPGAEEMVLALTATIDAGQVREELDSLGVLGAEGERPSIALRVLPAVGMQRDSEGLLTGLEQHLLRKLEEEGFVVVNPALRPDGGADENALELARLLGADLAVDVRVGWQQRELSSRLVGGVAEVRVRALRARDGFEVASSRFDAPAYHEDAEEALIRALEALQGQVSDNLVLQLNRNWRALSRGEGPVILVLSSVTSLLQVEAVQRTLRQVLGARQARLLELGPGSAELKVQVPLSPGALQDRLAAVPFDGFRLEPVEVGRGRLHLRVVLEIEGGSGPPTTGLERP